jgi:hypothetical protein
MAAKITKVGPVVVIQDDAQETVATFQVCYNQANLATCAITVWEIDGYVKTTSLSGTKGAIAPVPRISTKSGPFSPGEWLESLPGSARGY